MRGLGLGIKRWRGDGEFFEGCRKIRSAREDGFGGCRGVINSPCANSILRGSWRWIERPLFLVEGCSCSVTLGVGHCVSTSGKLYDKLR